jgi:nicotinate-nucleotide adenylyltransferase
LRIGIFGGTFDPIHNAHIAIAEAAKERFALDRVLVIPAANPPHKPRATAPFEHRYRMVELACADHPGLEPSLLESGEDRSYSIRTIEKVRASTSLQDSLYFIIGADAFSEIRTWHRWEDVVASVEFIVVTRPAAEYTPPDGAKVHRLEALSLPVSSSEIRAALAQGDVHPPDLDPGVYRYIVQHKLYAEPDRI